MLHHTFMLESNGTAPQQIAKRAKIIVLAGEGLNNRQIMCQLDVSRDMVRLWQQRWLDTADSDLSVWDRLQDLPRPGRPPIFTAEQLCRLYATFCEDPTESGRPINRWTLGELADEMVKREIVESISPQHVGRLLDEADLKPHRTRYWMTPQPDEQLDEKIKDILTLALYASKVINVTPSKPKGTRM